MESCIPTFTTVEFKSTHFIHDVIHFSYFTKSSFPCRQSDSRLPCMRSLQCAITALLKSSMFTYVAFLQVTFLSVEIENLPRVKHFMIAKGDQITREECEGF